jgi:hypothetical protein
MRFWAGALLVFVGLVLGAGLVVFGPRLAGPYLPEAFRGDGESVEGEDLGSAALRALRGRPDDPEREKEDWWRMSPHHIQSPVGDQGASGYG